MAKSTKKQTPTYALKSSSTRVPVNYKTGRGITHTLKDDYWKADNKDRKWRNQDEYNLMKNVIDRTFELMHDKATTCYWANYPDHYNIQNQSSDANQSSESSGSDWHAQFNLWYKQWIMWRQQLAEETNIKSPMSYAPVEAALAEFISNNITLNISAGPRMEESEEKEARIYQGLVIDTEQEGDYAYAKADIFQESMIIGSGISYNCYTKEEREHEMILSRHEVKDRLGSLKEEDEEYKTMQSTVDGGKPVTEKRKITVKEGLEYIPVSPFEFYVGKDSRCLEGPSHEAVDCLWRTTPSVEQARDYLKTCYDPFIIKENIEKINSAYDAYRDGEGTDPFFFRIAEDIDEGADNVVMIRYYNKITDKYIIIVNDVVVRDGPLPYNHKKLPFSLHRFGRFPHMFWGVGIPAVLESLQSEDEIMRNLMIKQFKLDVNPPTLINTDVFEDIDSQWERAEAGQRIEVGGPVGDQNIRYLTGPAHRYEGTSLRQELRADAVQASGINPLMYATPTPGQPVRNNIMSMESTYKILRKGIFNWGLGYKQAWRQLLLIADQVYPDLFEELENEEGEMTEKYRAISIEGYALTELEDGLEEQVQQGSSRFELKPKYLGFAPKLRLHLNLDEFVPTTQAVKMDKIEKAFATLIPLFMNPQAMQNPGIIELIHEYCLVNGLNKRVTEMVQDYSKDEDIAEAMEQTDDILRLGEAIPGEPGKSDRHKIVHMDAVINLTTQIINEGDKMDPAELEDRKKKLSMLSDHLQGDSVPKDQGVNYALQGSSQVLTPPQPAAPMAPQSGAEMPPQAMEEMMGGMAPGEMAGAMPIGPENAGPISPM